MNPYYTLALVGFLVLVAVLLVRYVNTTVDRQFRSLARAAEDEAFRKERMALLSNQLAGTLPLPAEIRPLPGPKGGGWRALPPVLTVLGIILLWGGGGGVAREFRTLWLYGGLVALGIAAAILLVTLHRRKWARTARLLLFRADLRRMDGDREGAAGDLRQLLRLTPWDDAAWAELSDDLAVSGELADALSAMSRASSLDPEYDEYHMLQASLAIRLKDFVRARSALADWRQRGGADADDPRLAVYQAALDLAEGRREKAEAAVKTLLPDGDAGKDPGWEFLDGDRALEDVRALFPGGSGKQAPKPNETE